MKKPAVALFALSASVLGMLAQGTFSASNNYIPTLAANGSALNVAGRVDKAFIYDTDGSLLAKATGRFEILNQGVVITPVTDGLGNAIFASAGGVFSLTSAIVVPGVPAGPANVTLTIRAWDNSTGLTYATALEKGETTFVMNSLGGGNGGADAPASMKDHSTFIGLQLGGGAVVPEPSTMALAALGVAGLFFVVRRK